MSRNAQEVRQNAYSNNYGLRAKQHQLWEDYFNLVLDLVDALARTRVIDSDVVVKFEPYFGGNVNVSITPRLGYSDNDDLPPVGDIGKEFNMEGFKIMQEMFDPEEGFSVNFGQIPDPASYGYSTRNCVTVTMSPPDKNDTQESK